MGSPTTRRDGTSNLWLSPRNSSLSRARRGSLSPFWIHSRDYGDGRASVGRTSRREGDLWFFSLQHTSLHFTLGQFVFPISKANRSGAARCWKPASLADSRGLSHCAVQLLSWSAEFRSLACSRTAKREKSKGLRKRGADVGCSSLRSPTEDKDNGS